MPSRFSCAIGPGTGNQGRLFPSCRQATRWLTLVQETECSTLSPLAMTGPFPPVSLSFPTGAITGWAVVVRASLNCPGGDLTRRILAPSP